MCSEEWIPHAKLVELNEKFLSRLTCVAWDIRTTKKHP